MADEFEEIRDALTVEAGIHGDEWQITVETRDHEDYEVVVATHGGESRMHWVDAAEMAAAIAALCLRAEELKTGRFSPLPRIGHLAYMIDQYHGAVSRADFIDVTGEP